MINKIEKDILSKIDYIVEEDNPFVYNYYGKLLKIKEILKNIFLILNYYKCHIDESYIKDINNLLKFGCYYDDFEDKLDKYIYKLTGFLKYINILLNQT